MGSNRRCVVVVLADDQHCPRLRAFCDAATQRFCPEISLLFYGFDQGLPDADASICIVHDEMVALPEERFRCKHDFWLCLENSTSQATLLRFERLVWQVVMHEGLPPIAEWTHFVCLTWPDLEGQAEAILEACEGCDAVELRVDLLADQSPQSLQRQVAVLREVIPSHMVVIYTVRSDDEGGKHPAAESVRYATLLMEGLRAGVDCVDIEASKARLMTTQIDWALYRSCRVLASKHEIASSAVLHNAERQLQLLLDECMAACPQANMLKVVTVAINWQHALELSNAALRLQQHWTSQPFICIAMGEAGAMTRVLNRIWTPVTHSCLPVKAAPGQLSLAQIMDVRRELNVVPPKQFYLFGTDISRSPSPAMHNAAFQWFKLPHEYFGFQTNQITHIVATMAAHDFGGASVTMPFKEMIVTHLDEVSGPATAIKAVNTVTVIADHRLPGKKRLVGHNTDWIGILRPISSALARKRSDAQRAMLIIGAGGTARAAAYAGQQLGMQLLVHNRTADKAQQIVDDFGGRVVSDLSEDLDASTLAVIISTIPPRAQVELPEHLFQHKPIAFDVVYFPPVTPLVAQAQRFGCTIILGKDMLLEQAKEQQIIWHGKQPPHAEMKAALEQAAARLSATVDSEAS